MESLFPVRPSHQDEVRTTLLKLLEVPNYPGVFALGCFARYVTIYSQQVRALNLVDALVKDGRLSSRSSIAVLGGGIAGLTVAAAAAVKGVRNIQVFEKHDATMRDQRVCSERFLHPHIYDWPQMVVEGKSAGLPILNWESGWARDVVTQLDKAVSDLQEHGYLSNSFIVTNCGEMEILFGPGAQLQVKRKSEPAQNFDFVILAIGFGTDAMDGTFPYWENFGLDSPNKEKAGETWLVSGFGDGALTDLMRLCIRDFLHENVLQAFRTLPALDSIAKTLTHNPDNVAAAYHSAAEALSKAFTRDPHLQPRNMGSVLLNCSQEQLFSPRSSILNRLICACLLKANRFQLRPGKIIEIKKIDAGYQITFDDPANPPLLVSHVILRHGPHAGAAISFGLPAQRQLESAFPDIWDQTRPLRDIWNDAAQHADWTRLPLFSPDDFVPGTDYSGQMRVDFGDMLGCLVLQSSKPDPDPGLASRVRTGLSVFAQRLKSRRTDLQVQPKPEVISIQHVFSPTAPWKFERAIRAICHAPFAVFDLSGGEAGMMVLLGIRAAVRRGVTIVVTQRGKSAESLPFNISSLNPIPVGPSGPETWRLLANALETGFRSLHEQPDRYLDLPVFDCVREIGSDTSPRQPERQILFLRWFDDRYGVPLRELINGVIEQLYPGTNVLTILDSQSPQLVEQRLYAEIRRTRFCIADWTGWRPNVFFEVGVRLAVNAEDPIHILCTKAPAQWKGGKWPAATNALNENTRLFFGPFPFDFEKSDALKARLEDFGKKTFGCLSPGRIYKIVSQLASLEKDPVGIPVPDYLSLRARLLDGEAGPDDSTLSPVLYSDTLSELARNAAVEHLLAAYYYVRERYALLPKADSNLQKEVDTLIAIGREVTGRMRTATDPQFKSIRLKILRELKAFEAKPDGFQ